MTASGPTPVIAGSWITVLAGETVFVEATLAEGKLRDLKAVSEVHKPDRTLMFRLQQSPELNEGLGMVLTVQSPFAGVLKYRLGMMLPDGERLLQTSACPLQQGIAAYESWPHPIFQIVAADFRVVKPESAEAGRCE